MYSHNTLEGSPGDRSKLITFYLFVFLGSATSKRTQALPLPLRYPKYEQFDLTSLFAVRTECSRNTLYKTHLAATEEY
jgi:hypothetical protein